MDLKQFRDEEVARLDRIFIVLVQVVVKLFLVQFTIF